MKHLNQLSFFFVLVVLSQGSTFRTSYLKPLGLDLRRWIINVDHQRPFPCCVCILKFLSTIINQTGKQQVLHRKSNIKRISLWSMMTVLFQFNINFYSIWTGKLNLFECSWKNIEWSVWRNIKKFYFQKIALQAENKMSRFHLACKLYVSILLI